MSATRKEGTRLMMCAEYLFMYFSRPEFDRYARFHSWGSAREVFSNRNTDGKYTEAHGINISKEFMPSVASSDDLRRYKVVAKNQFAYSPMQTGRDECIRIALLRDDTPIIVSPAYFVLQKRTDKYSKNICRCGFHVLRLTE